MIRAIAIVALVAACQGPPSELGSSFPPSVECAGDTQVTGSPAMPKNVVFIMADGAGPMHWRAGEVEKGAPLAFAATMAGPVWLNTDSLTTDRTEDTDSAPTDSAAAATALASGVRTLNGKVGVDDTDADVTLLGEIARDAGKAVGVVTNTFVYDASPAAFVGHAASREDLAPLVANILDGVRPDVWLGAGVELFDVDDGGALAAAAETAGYTIVRTADELAAWDPAVDATVLGIFPSPPAPVPGVYEWGLTPVVLRTADTVDPRLPDLVARALDGVGADPDGFFLFVENEHPDTMSHSSLVVTETAVDGIPLEILEVDAALQVVLDWVAAHSSFDETLVVVGSDHETGGYSFDGDDPSTAQFPDAPLHTRKPVPFYAVGPGSEKLGSMCRISDPFLLFTGRL